jgi:hypothetical protein
VVRSGHTLHHGLLVRDRSGAGLAIATNGGLTASVVDPATGDEVGGFAGWQTLPGVVFRVPPGGTERIPLLIGTASVDPGAAAHDHRLTGRPALARRFLVALE